MGDGGVESPSPACKPFTFEEYSDDMCAYYMAIGVPYHDYWRGDPEQLRHYVQAHELYREQKNQELWMQGLYNSIGFNAAIQLFGWQLGGKKGVKPESYPLNPIPITEREREAERQRSIEKTLAWIQAGQSEQ